MTTEQPVETEETLTSWVATIRTEGKVSPGPGQTWDDVPEESR